MEVFKCQAVEYCPGGSPGTCPGGREGIPCSECPSGTAWTGEECVQCSGGLVAVPLPGQRHRGKSVFFKGALSYACWFRTPSNCISTLSLTAFLHIFEESILSSTHGRLEESSKKGSNSF
jgi:hypothetical protein